MNSRGDLLQNTLGIIIAVLCISLLVFGLFKAFSFANHQESENAKHFLNSLVEKIRLVEDGTGTIVLQGYGNADNWYLAGWDMNEAGAPDKCFGSSCICICDGHDSTTCQKSGFCSKESFLYVNTTVLVDHVLARNGESIRAESTFDRFYPLKENLNEFIISRQGDRLDFVLPRREVQSTVSEPVDR